MSTIFCYLLDIKIIRYITFISILLFLIGKRNIKYIIYINLIDKKNCLQKYLIIKNDKEILNISKLFIDMIRNIVFRKKYLFGILLISGVYLY